MPQIPAANVDSKSASTSFVDARGQTTTVRADNLPNAVTPAQVLAYQNAIGNMSNAAVYETRYSEEQTSSIPAVVAYDEAESSVQTGANLNFQNSVTLQFRSFRVPAIDASCLDASGNFVNPANPLVDAAVNAILAMLGGSWGFVNGTVSTRARGVAQSVQRPLIEEPTGTTPPPAPGA